MDSVKYSSKAAASAFGESMIRVGTPLISAQLKVPEGRAERAMTAVVTAVFAELARTTVYIPAAFDSRNKEIFEKYHQPSRGAAACSYDRIRQLASEYALTSRAVYKVIQRMREAGHVAKGVAAGSAPEASPLPVAEVGEPSRG